MSRLPTYEDITSEKKRKKQTNKQNNKQKVEKINIHWEFEKNNSRNCEVISVIDK